MNLLYVNARLFCQMGFRNELTNSKNMRITTVFLSYRRAILIAVYTHLLRVSLFPPFFFPFSFFDALLIPAKSARRRFTDMVAMGQHCTAPRRMES